MANNDIQRGTSDENLDSGSRLDLDLTGNEGASAFAPTIQVAQADTNASDTAEVAATGNPATITIELEDGPIVRLPEGTSLDAPRQNGADLEFVQPDGSVIVVVGGAVTGLTIFIGDIQIPPDGVQAIFDANGIEPAEGPDQGPVGDSHGNFDDVPNGNVGDGLEFGGLLGPTELLFGTPERTELFAITPPVMLIGDGFAEEDDLAMRVGERSLGNNEDGSFDAHTVSGSLVSDFGSGGAHPTDALSFTGTPPAGLTSQGEPITYSFVDTGNGQILQAFASSGEGDEPRLVFELELIVSGNTGSYTFTLYDQLDHALTDDPDTSEVETAFEDIMSLGFGIEARNADGATSDGTLNIGVQDDVPVYLGEGSTHYVDEDDIDTNDDHGAFQSEFYGPGYHFAVQDGSLGTSPNDGPGWPDFDGSYTDSPYTNGPGAAFISGNISGLFSIGSDEFPQESGNEYPSDDEGQPSVAAASVPTSSGAAQFALSAENIADIEALGLSSHSEGLSYYLADNGDGSFSLFGYVPTSGGDDPAYEVAARISEEIFEGAEGRLVFKFDLDSNGNFEFRLFDQLDHSLTDNPDTETVETAFEDLISLDFSSLVTITDFDGDTITAPEGALVINLRDDVPELGHARPVSLVLDEDDIDTSASLGTEIEDGNGDGSYTGPAGSSVGGPATTEADISGLVSGGADEQITFSFLSSDLLRSYLEGLGLMSQGRPIGFDLTMDGTIIGFVNALGGAVPGQTYDLGEGDRQVFEITLSEDGHIKVELYDQLDHVAPDSGADENQTLETEGFSSFNLGEVIVATDHDGDSITLGGQVVISITDDVPVLTGERIVRTVDEDDIQNDQSLGTSPQDGPADGSYTENPGDEAPGAAHVFGSLAGLVQSGADEGLTFSFINESAIRAALEDLGLTSKGGTLSYDVQGDTLYAFVNADAPGVIYNEGQDRLVFELSVDTDGNYEFKLHDQLDHDAPGDDYSGPDPLSDENFDLQDTAYGDVTSIDFGQFIKATDFDGDSVVLQNGLSIQVRDDVPVIAENTEPVSITVDEDDIDTEFSLGTEIEDDNGDGSYTGPAGSSTGGPANATGTLAGLVHSGADEALTYGFTANAVAKMLAMNIDSQGRNISYEVVGTTLYAFINAGEAGNIGSIYNEGQDQLVFTLKVDADTGEFTFSLYDQLDHAPGNDQNTLDIDFGSVLQATDFDGDSVVLEALVNVTVTDDVPVLADVAPVALIVDEDDILTDQSTGTSPNDDDDLDGSFTGPEGAGGSGPANATANLAGLVASGADEGVTFSFVSDTEVRSYLEGLGLMSQGRPIGYDLREDGTIIGFVNHPDGVVPGETYDEGDDRLVFKLTLSEGGQVTFELYDQLDHDAPFDDYGDGSGLADENTDLQDDVVGDVTAIDFGHLIEATDHDGDSIALDGKFTVTITDDVPSIEARAGQGPLTIDETTGLQDNDVASNSSLSALFAGIGNKGSDPDMATQYAQQAGFVVADVTAGADEPATVSWALQLNGTSQFVYSGLQTTDGNHNIFLSLENGIIVGRVDVNGTDRGHTSEPAAFAIHLNADGTLTVVQYMAIRHTDANDHDATDSLIADAIRAVATVTDADGDHAVDSVNIGAMIQFDDDGPSVGSNATVVVEDDDLAPNGIELGSGDDFAPLNTTGTLAHTYGADGAGSTLLSGVVLPDVGGFDYTVTNGGRTLTISQDGTDVLRVHLSNTTGGNYTVTQLAPIDHPAGLDENNVEFAIQYRVTDGDGDHATGTLTINVDDDTPELLQAPQVVVTLDEDDIDTGLSLGNQPNDTDDPDGSFTGQAGVDNHGPATVTGTLTQFVASGADVPLTFGIYSGDLSVLENMGITSQGDMLSYVVDTSTPGVEVLRASADGRVVFELTINADGTFKAELYDQIDHVAPPAGTSDENFAIDINPDPVSTLPIGQLIEARDADGDAVSLGDNVILQIRDDVPEIVTGATPVSGTVQESEVASSVPTVNVVLAATSFENEAITGSSYSSGVGNPGGSGGVYSLSNHGGQATVVSTSSSSSAGDLGFTAQWVDGTTNVDDGLTNDAVGVTSVTSEVGSYDDGAHGYRFFDTDGVMRVTFDAVDLTGVTNGQLSIAYFISPNPGDVYDPTDHFTIRVVTDAGTVVMFDQNGSQIESGPDGVWVTLTANLPVSATTATLVVEANTSVPTEGFYIDDIKFTGDVDGTPVVTPDTTDVDLSTLVAIGADDQITFSLTSFASTAFGSYTSNGHQIMISSDGDTLIGTANGETVFTLTLTPAGSATFSLYGEFDHDGTDTLALDLGAYVQATDYDGDTVGLGANLFVINVEDGGDPLEISGSATGTVEEEHLAAVGIDDAISFDGNDQDTGPSDLDQTTTQASGTLDALVTGGDAGPLDFAFANVVDGDPVFMAGGGNLTSGGVNVQFHHVSDTLIQGYVGDTSHVVFSLEITDQETGAWTFTLFDKVDHHAIESADEVEGTIGIDFGGLIVVTDTGDSDDSATIDSFVVEVIDDVPEAVASSAEVSEGAVQDINAALVLDYSLSIDYLELPQMLAAVKAAGQQLFSSAGNVSVTVVAFGQNADTLGIFTNYAAFEAAIDATNVLFPDDRPVLPYGTDYTAAIDELLNNSGYTPVSGESNQIFFLSDGNPSEQMDGINVLQPGTASAWDAFVNGAVDVSVTAIGVGNAINTGNLQQIDIDGNGAPIMVDNFVDLAEALVGAIAPSEVSGNVIEDSVGTAFGADGGHILSITHDEVTYTYDRDTDTITSSGGTDGTDAGSGVLELITELGGTLTFDFTSGEWSYAAPSSGVTSDTSEVFQYTLIDGDGDTASADLTITVNVNEAPVATDDTVLTNIIDGSMIHIPTNALTWNDSDPDGDPLSVTDVSNPVGGTASVGSVIFDPDNPTDATLVDATFRNVWDGFYYDDNRFDELGVLSGTGSDANGYRSDFYNALLLDLGGNSSSDRTNMNGAFVREFTLAAAATVTLTFNYRAGLDGNTDDGEDMHVLAAVDSVLLGGDGTIYKIEGQVGAVNDDINTGWLSYSTTVFLDAGTHYLSLGGVMTGKTSSNETAYVDFDNVEITVPGVISDGSVDYTVSDGSLDDTAGVTIHGVAGSTITATSDDGQILIGGAGDDFLIGAEGDDVLVGGLGSDEMTGNGGADLFIISADTVSPDILDLIADYDQLEGDVVDLSDLFTVGTDEDVADFVRYDSDTGMIQVDQNGATGGASFENVVDIGTGLSGTINIIFDDDGTDTTGTI